MNELAPNPYLIPFALELVPYLSRSMRHSLLCAALDHRIYQIAEGTDSRKWVTNLRPKQLYHRGVAIRTLSDAIADDEERMKDSTLAALFLFFYMDVSRLITCPPASSSPSPSPSPASLPTLSAPRIRFSLT